MAQGTAVKMYNVKRGSVDKKDPNKKFWSSVGKVGIREDGTGGFLRLNHLSGEFAIFSAEKGGEGEEGEGGGGGGGGGGDYRGRQAKLKGGGYGNGGR
jgi:hypothetical protein